MKIDEIAVRLVKTYPRTLANNARVGRAIKAVERGMVKRTGKHTFKVQSLSRPGLTHKVNLAKQKCDCEDCEKGNVCFHRIAAQLYLEGK